MECALVSALPEVPDWTYEVKLDGYRAIGVKGRDAILYSRNHKNFNKRFPQIAEAIRSYPLMPTRETAHQNADVRQVFCAITFSAVVAGPVRSMGEQCS
jgi:hypothetical protein